MQRFVLTREITRIGREAEADELMTLADQALYRAKEKGRNRVETALRTIVSPEPDTFES